MDQATLIALLKKYETISGIKTKQPWAAWIFFKGKTIDIRTTNNRHRGLVAIIATSWDTYFSKEIIKKVIRIPYDFYAVIGFCKLTDVKEYYEYEEFVADQHLHLNPKEFFRSGLYGWKLEDATPIEPIYYECNRNKTKPNLIQLQGQMARVRINTRYLINRARCISLA
jgi:hypothetical protein